MTQRIAGEDVSRETYDQLVLFGDLVQKWTRKINLIASSTVPNLWERHIVDSAQLYRYAPTKFDHWADIGSGAGFPGIVMAIYARTHQPDAAFTLIESDQRKAEFLRTASRELRLNLNVLAQRIEDTKPQNADVVSARALTTLSTLIPLTLGHLKPDGHALFHKGKRAAQEVAEARQSWSFDLEEYPSLTDPDARLLVIQRISRAG
jgi:16S rRNA (guanine527-N7)-methyltransferase